jgi:hypothetical protein
LKYTNKIILILIIIIVSIFVFNIYERYLTIKKINDAKDIIIIDSPKPYQKVQVTIIIKGKAKGSFFFEGTFPIRIEDENGNLIVSDYIMTKENWMTENFVSFETHFYFEKGNLRKGFIIFEKANPSGLLENKFEIRIPLYFE